MDSKGKERPGLDLDEDSLASIDNALNTERNENEGNAVNGETKLNMNRYATMKTVAEGMLDIALLASNASQLKSVLQAGEEANQFYTLIITLLCISIIFQVTIGICLVFIGTLDVNNPRRQKNANTLNNAITIQIMLLTVINVLISAFGSMSKSEDNGASDDRSDANDDRTISDAHNARASVDASNDSTERADIV